MTKILIVLAIALVFEALGVVILKRGIDQITAREKARQGGEIKVSTPVVLRLVGHGVVGRESFRHAVGRRGVDDVGRCAHRMERAGKRGGTGRSKTSDGARE